MSSIDFTSFLKLMAHKKASDLFVTAGVPPSIESERQIVAHHAEPADTAAKPRSGAQCDESVAA